MALIRLAHISPFMGVGGAEQMILHLCRHRNRAAFECIVAAPHDGVIADEIRATGVPVYTGPAAYGRALRWADIVNLHATGYDAPWHALVRASGKPYVTTLMSLARMPRLPAITICSSDYLYHMQEHKDRCVAIPNGIDLAEFAPRPKPKRESVVITRVCRSNKCALYFWDAMKRVLERYPHVQLWIAGNDEGARPRSDRVRFLGVRRDIARLLAETDIFAYAAYPEYGTRDLVAMEASGMGVPCVVSDVNSMRETIEDGQNGFLTPFEDSAAFAEKVGILVEDAGLRARMGEAGVRIARERFDVRRVARCYEAVYRAVLNANGGR